MFLCFNPMLQILIFASESKDYPWFTSLPSASCLFPLEQNAPPHRALARLSTGLKCHNIIPGIARFPLLILILNILNELSNKIIILQKEIQSCTVYEASFLLHWLQNRAQFPMCRFQSNFFIVALVFAVICMMFFFFVFYQKETFSFNSML